MSVWLQTGLDDAIDIPVCVLVSMSPLALAGTRNIQRADLEFLKEVQGACCHRFDPIQVCVYQHQGPVVLFTKTCGKGSAPFQFMRIDDQGAITLQNVFTCTVCIVIAGMFSQRVSGMYHSIFCSAAPGAITAARKVIVERGIQCSPVNARLPAGYDFPQEICPVRSRQGIVQETARGAPFAFLIEILCPGASRGSANRDATRRGTCQGQCVKPHK